MSEHLPGTGHDAPDHHDPVATEDPVAGEDAVSDPETPEAAARDAESPDAENPDGNGPADADSPVGTAMRRLDGLGDRPVEEHPEVYEEVHTVLRRSLDDEGSTPP